MSKLVVVRDTKFQQHLTPQNHPESPQRLVAIDEALHSSHLIELARQFEPRVASEEELMAAHKSAYIERLKETADKLKVSGQGMALDADTYMSPLTYDTAKLAAGAGLVAVDALGATETESSFVVVRPPGHHALPDKPMGFCLFNNIALAARYAQKKLGLKRIMIIDWDVHHGNGTQDMFYDDPSVFFVSLHQYPLWPPNSGWYTQDGVGDGKGYNLNIPLPSATGDVGYLKAFEELVCTMGQEYEPELILLSAGYDAHQFDPLAQQQISTGGYRQLSQKLLKLAQNNQAKIAAFLEGGYNTTALAESVVATMQVLNQTSGETTDGKSLDFTGDGNRLEVKERIADIKMHFCQYWKCLRRS